MNRLFRSFAVLSATITGLCACVPIAEQSPAHTEVSAEVAGIAETELAETATDDFGRMLGLAQIDALYVLPLYSDDIVNRVLVYRADDEPDMNGYSLYLNIDGRDILVKDSGFFINKREPFVWLYFYQAPETLRKSIVLVAHYRGANGYGGSYSWVYDVATDKVSPSLRPLNYAEFDVSLGEEGISAKLTRLGDYGTGLRYELTGEIVPSGQVGEDAEIWETQLREYAVPTFSDGILRTEQAIVTSLDARQALDKYDLVTEYIIEDGEFKPSRYFMEKDKYRSGE